MRKRIASDDDLVQAVVCGDEAAFAELMQRHRRWVQAIMYAFVHDHQQAEDLTQETFCRVYQHAGRFAAQGTFVAWLKRIAVNLAKDFLRKKKQATFVPLHEVEERIAEDSRFDPIGALASEALREDLRAAIQSLPDEQRLALAMHYFGDMSLQDIAWAMKCSVGTVKSRLFYGLRRVRRAMADKWEKEEGGPVS